MKRWLSVFYFIILIISISTVCSSTEEAVHMSATNGGRIEINNFSNNSFNSINYETYNKSNMPSPNEPQKSSSPTFDFATSLFIVIAILLIFSPKIILHILDHIDEKYDSRAEAFGLILYNLTLILVNYELSQNLLESVILFLPAGAGFYWAFKNKKELRLFKMVEFDKVTQK